tara:strand:+ start:148 stop:603 length:456 start_codon:yes stop_codon:yes gene_type:complete
MDNWMDAFLENLYDYQRDEGGDGGRNEPNVRLRHVCLNLHGDTFPLHIFANASLPSLLQPSQQQREEAAATAPEETSLRHRRRRNTTTTVTKLCPECRERVGPPSRCWAVPEGTEVKCSVCLEMFDGNKDEVTLPLCMHAVCASCFYLIRD